MALAADTRAALVLSRDAANQREHGGQLDHVEAVELRAYTAQDAVAPAQRSIGEALPVVLKGEGEGRGLNEMWKISLLSRRGRAREVMGKATGGKKEKCERRGA